MQKGQILLIIVLTMIVALTVGLSLVARSVVNLKTSNEDANSQKAFQAAEAGIEIGLQKQQGSGDIIIGQKTLDSKAVINSVNIHNISGSSIVLNNGNPVLQDQGIDIWLTNYPNYSGNSWTGSLDIFWGAQSGCQDAAMETIVISGSSASDPNITINRYGIDPCGTNSIDASKNRNGDNKFSRAQSGGNVNGKNLNFSTSISITNGLIARLVPLYASSPIAVVGYTNGNPAVLQNFPSQGRIITSTGSFGNTVRQVSFFQGYPILPNEFFYTIFQE